VNVAPRWLGISARLTWSPLWADSRIESWMITWSPTSQRQGLTSLALTRVSPFSDLEVKKPVAIGRYLLNRFWFHSRCFLKIKQVFTLSGTEKSQKKWEFKKVWPLQSSQVQLKSMKKNSKSNQSHSLCVNKSSQLKSDRKSRFFLFYRDARVADLTHLRAKTCWFRGFCAIFLLNDRLEMFFFC